jgi:putative oxidoreductase
MKDILDLIGRVLIAAIFLYESYDTIAHWQSTKQTLTAYGLHWNQDLLISGAGLLLFFGGLLLLIGYRVALGSVLLLCYWIPVTFIIYSFWNDPIEYRRVSSISFMKNMAIVGGLLHLILKGSGKYSVKKLISVLKIRRKKL